MQNEQELLGPKETVFSNVRVSFFGYNGINNPEEITVTFDDNSFVRVYAEFYKNPSVIKAVLKTSTGKVLVAKCGNTSIPSTT